VADGAEEDAFITRADLPLGDALSGAWVIRTDGAGYTHGYEIARVEKRGAETIIVLTEDPAVRIEGDTATEVYCPSREIAGENSFRIPLAATIIRQGVR
jgi:hypothetical protein